MERSCQSLKYHLLLTEKSRMPNYDKTFQERQDPEVQLSKQIRIYNIKVKAYVSTDLKDSGGRRKEVIIDLYIS